jgi:hypothetical protein
MREVKGELRDALEMVVGDVAVEVQGLPHGDHEVMTIAVPEDRPATK